MVCRQPLLLVVVLLTTSAAASWTSDASFATSTAAKDATCKQHDHMSVLQLGTTRASSQQTQTQSNSLAVDEIKTYMPAVALALLGAATLFLVFTCVVNAATVPYTMALAVYMNFQDNFFFTLVLVRSHGLADHFHANPLISGWLVGGHKLGTALGMMSVFLALKVSPEFWRKTWTVYSTAVVLQVISAGAFAACAFLGDAGLAGMAITRPLMGLGGGFQVSLAFTQVAHLGGQHRALYNLRVFVGGCIGIGAGPLLSSLATTYSRPRPFGEEGFEGMLTFVALAPWMQVSLLLLRSIPSLDHVTAQSSPQRASRAQALIVCLCLAMLVLRNLALSSLEVGLAQLAQTHYKFDHLSAGLLCAITVFITLPVQFLYESSERCRFSLGTMLWTGLAASCLLLSEKFVVFYLGALLFFPMMVLSSGLVMAKMQEYAMPDGSLLDRNTTTLLGLVMADLFGRALGPISARLSISAGGQHAFALTQIMFVSSSLLLHLASGITSHQVDEKGSLLESPESTCSMAIERR